jgi:hypothetical protein
MMIYVILIRIIWGFRGRSRTQRVVRGPGIALKIVHQKGDSAMKTKKAFVIGILGLLLAFGMVLAGCEQSTGGGGDDDTNNNNNNNNNNNSTPTTGILVITNTSPDWYILSVEIRETGETTVLQKYNGSPLGRDKTCEFSLPTGVYDVKLKDDYPDTLDKTGVVVTVGKTTNLTYNGDTILSN